jgi:hypothetical protein
MERFFGHGLFAVACAASVASAAFGQTLQPGMWRAPGSNFNTECPPNPASLSYTWNQSNALNWLTYNGSDSAHDYFCGNGCKAGNGNPCAWASGCCVKSPATGCRSYGTFGTNDGWAKENVEVRGWIVSADGLSTCDSEWHFDLLLDVGWTPTNGTVYALNSIDRIATWMPPTNLTTWATQLSSNTYGGYQAPVLHAEVDAWNQFRSNCIR